MSKSVLPRLGVLAVAALVAIAACTADQVTAPAKKSAAPATISKTVHTAAAGHVEICIDDLSPNANYFVDVSTPQAADGTDSLDLSVDIVTTHTVLQPNGCVDVLERFSNMESNGAMCWYQVPAGSGNWVSSPCPPGTAFAAGWVNVTVSVDPTTPLPGSTSSWTCVVADPATPSYCAGGASGTGNTARNGANKWHGANTTFLFTAPIPTACTLSPWIPPTTRSPAVFNESEVLAAYGYDAASRTIRAWYTDEHALAIGVRQVSWNWSGTANDSVHTYGIAKMGVAPATLLTLGKASSIVGTPLVDVGFTGTTGEGAAVDAAGRPLYPAVFITDITSNPSSKSGDWQNFGLPTGPNAIYGSWKSATLLVDHTKNPVQTNFSPDADPAKNHKDVAGGPAVPAGVADQGFTSVVIWNAASLGLNPSHNYRLQFMVHDGDQNKNGGDVGQACMNIGPNVPDRLVVDGKVIY